MQENSKEELWHESLPGIIRENLIWYKENGTDHWDLVVAEEAILDKVKQTPSKREAETREEIVTKIMAIFEKFDTLDGVKFATALYFDKLL